MKWFDRWFVRKCRWAWDNRDLADVAEQPRLASAKGLVIEEDPGWSDGLRIGIKKMIGGYVVSFRIYDRVRDRSEDRSYIITDEQDFNNELGKIITMESMRQS